MKMLIVYASRYGQTEKIARRIAEVAGAIDVKTDVVSIAAAEKLPLSDYDYLIVAGSVYFGRHSRQLEDFVRRKLTILSAMEAAFVSVSGSKDEAFIHDFARRTGWIPEIYALFAGGEPYTKYGFFTRMLMRAIAKKHGRVVDVRQDYEFTDWDAVDRFAHDFIGYASAKQKSA